MTTETPDDVGAAPDAMQDAPAPACVMSFNASDPSGAGGLSGDVATIAAMGAHALPVVAAILMRDTAEVFDQHAIDTDQVDEQARRILEDVTISGFKVGFLGSAENASAVAEILSDYPDVPVVTYLPNLSWMEEDDQQSYLDAVRELILPAAGAGSEVTLWGCGPRDAVLAIDELAAAAGTIGYELMCAVAPRVPVSVAD